MQNANNYDELLDRATQAVLDRAPRDLPPNELILATKTMVEQAQQVSHVAVAPARQAARSGVGVSPPWLSPPRC